MGVKQDACNIPLALQHQMLIQAALSVLALVLAALAMLFFSITVSVPFLLCAVLLATRAVSCARGHGVEVRAYAAESAT